MTPQTLRRMDVYADCAISGIIAYFVGRGHGISAGIATYVVLVKLCAIRRHQKYP